MISVLMVWNLKETWTVVFSFVVLPPIDPRSAERLLKPRHKHRFKERNLPAAVGIPSWRLHLKMCLALSHLIKKYGVG